MCSLSPAYSALSDYFVIGDFKLVPDFSIYSYDMKRVNYYNSGTASTPMLDRVLQTESGRFIHSYKDIGVISYSEELDKLVLTAEPYFTSKTCSTQIFENNVYKGTKDVKYVVPASGYSLSLFVGGVKVASASFNNNYIPPNISWTGPLIYNPDVPPIFELPIAFRRHVPKYADSYLRFSLYPKQIRCGLPQDMMIVDGPAIVRDFEIDLNSDSLPDFLEPWYLAERNQFIRAGSAASLLLN